MKKRIIVALLTCLPYLQAIDLEVDMGGGMYYANSDGNLIFTKEFWTNSSGKILHDSTPGVYTWVDLATDQKYWPKLYTEFRSLKTTGTSFLHVETENDVVNGLIEFIEKQAGKNLNEIPFDSRLTQIDIEAYLYYEYFEKSAYPTFGFGAGVKKFDFDYVVTLMDGVQVNSTGGDTIPLLYFKSSYMIDKQKSGSSISAEVGGKIYVFGDSNVYDYMGKVDFLAKYNSTTDIGLEMGFKKTYIHIKGDDVDTVGGYMSTSGVYLGLIAKFK